MGQSLSKKLRKLHKTLGNRDLFVVLQHGGRLKKLIVTGSL